MINSTVYQKYIVEPEILLKMTENGFMKNAKEVKRDFGYNSKVTWLLKINVSEYLKNG